MAAQHVPLSTKGAIDVSQYGHPPYNQLSPFFRHGGIPVPGRVSYLMLEELRREYLNESDLGEECFLDTVESVWQSVKCVDRQVEETTLSEHHGISSGRRFGFRCLQCLSARAAIYVPCYLFTLQNRSASVVRTIATVAQQKGVLIGDAPVIADPFSVAESMSHARLLVDYINGELNSYLAAQKRLQVDSARFVDIHDSNTGAELWALHRAWMDDNARDIDALASGAPLDSYQAWADRYELECRLHGVVDSVGSYELIPHLESMLRRLICDGTITEREAELALDVIPAGRL